MAQPRAYHIEIDACPMEGFVPPQFDELLQLGQQRLRSVVIAAAGYRTADDPAAGLKKCASKQVTFSSAWPRCLLDFALVSSAGEDRGLAIHNRAPSTARFFSCRISDFRLSDSRKSLKCPNSRSLSAHLIYFPARGTGVADSGIQAVLRRCIFALT